MAVPQKRPGPQPRCARAVPVQALPQRFFLALTAPRGRRWCASTVAPRRSVSGRWAVVPHDRLWRREGADAWRALSRDGFV